MNFGSWPSTNGSYILARIAAIEGDADGVVKHMQAAMEQNELEIQFFAVDPFFAEMRDEPRLMKIAAEARASALRPVRALIREDLPQLDLPATASSGSSASGKQAGSGHDFTKRASTTKVG